MFNNIKIRTRYAPMIYDLNSEDKAYILTSLCDIADGKEIDFSSTKAGGVLKFLYLDWMDMEAFSRCGVKDHLCYLYYIRLFSDTEDFIKIGISKHTEKRYTEYMKMGYDYEIIKEIAYPTRGQCFNKEQIEHNKYKKFSYLPKQDFGGKTECFTLDIFEDINESQTKSSQAKSIQILSKDKEQSSLVKVDKRILEIDIIIETLKNLNGGIIDDTIKKQRQYGKLIKDKMEKVIGFSGDYVGFITFAYENTENKANFVSLEKFYFNIANIIAGLKKNVKKQNNIIFTNEF